MSRTNIKTETLAVTTSFELLDVEPRSVLTMMAIGCDLYLCTGEDQISDATDERSFLLPAGAALEMQPVPIPPIYIKGSVAGSASIWYS